MGFVMLYGNPMNLHTIECGIRDINPYNHRPCRVNICVFICLARAAYLSHSDYCRRSARGHSAREESPFSVRNHHAVPAAFSSFRRPSIHHRHLRVDNLYDTHDGLIVDSTGNVASVQFMLSYDVSGSSYHNEFCRRHT